MSPRITILYDAFGKDSTMTKDWGYAALVEISGKRILFDTGDDPEILAKNAKAKGVDLKKLDFVVLSHRHGDHIGGFTFIRNVNPRIKVYAPKENFGVFGSDLPSTFYRKRRLAARRNALLRGCAARDDEIRHSLPWRQH
jgi:7,8-dihydropterin-6-yl-methyl-4-(beta-D-ribofuranosyl)aminobenzene 5'-phosphate synthase